MSEIIQDWTSRHMTWNLIHRDNSWGTIISLSYSGRDNSGNPTLIEGDSGDTSYDYDANSRLISENTTSFGYDWIGNRLNPPANPNPMVYNKADQLTSWPGNYSYTYHDDGSLYVVLNQYQTPVRSYSYHPSRLLNEAVYIGGFCSNTWDASSNRVGFTISVDDYTLVYDPTAGIPAVIEEVTSTGSVYYYREPNGELIARLAGENWSYYHFDELGSTRALTDGTGSVTDTYTYDAWGNVTDHTGSTEQPYQYVGRFGYYTHYQNSNFKLLQLGVRFYDPEIGRFAQRDTAKEGLNWYTYVRNAPVNGIDPTGLRCTPVGQAVRDDQPSIVPAPSFVKHLQTIYFWVQVGYEVTAGIGWGGRGSWVTCNCIWSRKGINIDQWKSWTSMKQWMSCQTWTPCGYGPRWGYWNRYAEPVFYRVAGNEFWAPTLPSTTKTPGMMGMTSKGPDCFCAPPSSPSSSP